LQGLRRKITRCGFQGKETKGKHETSGETNITKHMNGTGVDEAKPVLI